MILISQLLIFNKNRIYFYKNYILNKIYFHYYKFQIILIIHLNFKLTLENRYSDTVKNGKHLMFIKT